LAAACAARLSGWRGSPATAGAPTGGAGASLEQATLVVADAAREQPVLDDYVLYFHGRAAPRAGHPADALGSARRLIADHPDSIWVGPAWLMAGQLQRMGGDLAGARAALSAARGPLPTGSARWTAATLALAEVD